MKLQPAAVGRRFGVHDEVLMTRRTRESRIETRWSTDYEYEVLQVRNGRATKVLRTTTSPAPPPLTSELDPARDAFLQFEVLLPDRPVRVGETWESDALLGARARWFEHAAVTRTATRCTLEGAGGGRAVVGLVIDCASDKSRHEVTGWFRFDLAAGTITIVEIHFPGEKSAHRVRMERTRIDG